MDPKFKASVERAQAWEAQRQMDRPDLRVGRAVVRLIVGALAVMIALSIPSTTGREKVLLVLLAVACVGWASELIWPSNGRR